MEVVLSLSETNNKTIGNPEFTYAVRWTWVPTCAQGGNYKMHMRIFNTEEEKVKRFSFTVLRPQPQIYTNSTHPRHARIGCPVTLTASARDADPAVRAMGLEGNLQFWRLAVHRYDLRGVLHAVQTLEGSTWRQLPGRNDFNGTDAMFEWTPVRGQEGSTYQVCFLMQVL
jgi:hypothetical protein